MQTARQYLTSLGLVEHQIDNVYQMFDNPVVKPEKDCTPLIIDAICQYKGVDEQTLKTKLRKRPNPECRFLIFYFLRAYTLGSFNAIGTMFNRDHTSVIHGVKAVEDLMFSDRSFKHDVEHLTLIINQIVK